MPHIHLGELSQVPAFLKDLEIQPRIETKMETEGIADIITATRQDDGERMIRKERRNGAVLPDTNGLM